MSARNDTGNSALAYLQQSQALISRLIETQLGPITEAARICARAIAADGLVHCFGTGHSRIPVEELFPRHGSFPGFHEIVELSMTFHNQVVGANGQRQAMWLERVEGFGEVILRNFNFGPDDVFMIFSNSGVNGVVIDVALGAKRRSMPVIAVVSVDHCAQSAARHSSGQKLTDIADLVIDNGSPAGDAMVAVEGLDDPVAPGSTLGYAAVVNALKAQVAEELVRLGRPPLVLSSSLLIGEAASQRFDDCYDEYSRRIARLYHWPETPIEESQASDRS
jgi:uncharacterized phosphosugar-binding protein